MFKSLLTIGFKQAFSVVTEKPTNFILLKDLKLVKTDYSVYLNQIDLWQQI